MIQNAILFGRYVHRNQQRKFTGKAYTTHTEAVGDMAMWLGLSEYAIIAAYLHDSHEDQDVPFELLSVLFGNDASQGVWWLSDQSKPTDGNRAARKSIDRAHIAQAPLEIKTVKLIDSYDNLKDIRVNDPNFAKVYFREKRDLLEVLRDGDIRMVEMVQDLIDDYFAKGE